MAVVSSKCCVSEAHIDPPGLCSKPSLALLAAKVDEDFHTANILLVQGLWAE